MIQRTMRRVVVALGAIVGSALVACGGAPSDGESADQSQAMCKAGQICGCTHYVNGRCCPPGDYCPPSPPPPRMVTAWSYKSVAASASANPTWCTQNGFAPLANVKEQIHEYGVMSNSRDPVDVAELALMQSYGCSTPIRWSTFNPGSTDPGGPGNCHTGQPNVLYDFAYMHAMLCPDTAGVASYVSSIGQQTMPGECSPADHPAKISHAVCDMQLPVAPQGYVWAITSLDPTCPAGTGCMVGASGGPTTW